MTTEGLALIAFILLVPLGVIVTRLFRRRIGSRKWTTAQRVAYSLLCATCFAPGCLEVPTHAMSLPLPVLASAAALHGSFFGGVLPFLGCVAYVFSRTALRADYPWLGAADGQRATGSPTEADPKTPPN